MGSRSQLKGTFGHMNSTGRGRLPFSFDRTFSASSSDGRYFEDSSGNRNQELFFGDPLSISSTRSNPLQDSGVDRDPGEPPIKDEFFDHEDDELSTGLPSDLPSGLVDIEGVLINSRLDLRFGQEEGEDELNSEDDEVSSLPDDNQFHHYPRHRRQVRHGRRRSMFQDNSGESVMISNGKLPMSFRNPHHFLGPVTEMSSNLRRSVVPGGRKNIGGSGDGGKEDSGERKPSLSEGSSGSTITQHYYPEGGWGYVILITALLAHALVLGIHFSTGIFIQSLLTNFPEKVHLFQAG